MTRMSPVYVYPLGVLLYGGYLLVQRQRGKLSSSAYQIDTTHLAIALLALMWPIYLVAWLVFRSLGRNRAERIYVAWMRRRGFYYESVRQPDGTYHAAMVPLDDAGRCAVCTKTAPKMCVRNDEESPSTECTDHRHAFLCPEHRTDEVIEKLKPR